MTVCVVKVCRNYKGRTKSIKKVTYHRLPTDPIIRNHWIEIIRKSRNEEVWQPAKHSLICSDHFHRKDKDRVNNEGRLRLKKGAIPHKALFLSSLQSDESDVSDEEANRSDCADKRNMSKKIVPNEETSESDRVDKKDTFKETVPNMEISDFADKRDPLQETVTVKVEGVSPVFELEDMSDAVNTSLHFKDIKTENDTEVLEDSSDLDSCYDSPLEAKLRRQLRRRIKLQEKHTAKIQSQHKKIMRYKKNIVKFKEIISNLKKERCSNCRKRGKDQG